MQKHADSEGKELSIEHQYQRAHNSYYSCEGENRILKFSVSPGNIITLRIQVCSLQMVFNVIFFSVPKKKKTKPILIDRSFMDDNFFPLGIMLMIIE